MKHSQLRKDPTWRLINERFLAIAHEHEPSTLDFISTTMYFAMDALPKHEFVEFMEKVCTFASNALVEKINEPEQGEP